MPLDWGMYIHPTKESYSSLDRLFPANHTFPVLHHQEYL